MMNFNNFLTKSLFLTFSLVAFIACEDFEVENLNAPDSERALAEDSDVISLIDGSVTDMFYTTINLWAVHNDGLADQISTTNAYLDFWGFMDQPRRPINNNTTNSDLYPVSAPWNSMNSFIYNANTILGLVDGGKTLTDSDGNDVTSKKEMAAYFVRGVSLGFIGMLYDKAYRVDQSTDLATLEFENYDAIIGFALSDLDKALSLSSNGAGLRIYDGKEISNTEFIQVANSYAAKILMGTSRSADETVDYDKVLSYISNGISADFDPGAKNAVIFNNYQDWSTYTLSTGAGYLPVDQKVAYLAEGDATKQPQDYPSDNTIVLDSISNTSDPRVAAYFGYSTSFGYLRESRGRHLFTNTVHERFFTGNNRNFDGASLNLFPLAELHYLKAEAQLKKGDLSGAKATLDASARGTNGLTTGTDATSIAGALLYEYSIEMHLNGSGGTNYCFMRRHDLLQVGTPTQYPVPATELEITGDSFYTFGGDGANNPSTAPGPGWKAF
jgi:hypothetical protein